MSTATPSLSLFIKLSKIVTQQSRRFTGGLDGLGFHEFVILYHLAQAPEQKMRRIDLAEQLGLTASGVTRLLQPMEKIGLIKKEASTRDARVSFVTMTKSGERNYQETLAKTEPFFDGVFPEEFVRLEGLLR